MATAPPELLSTQVLFGLRVLDAVTWLPPRTPVTPALVSVAIGRPLSSLALRTLEDGRAAWYGDPRTALAALADGPLALRVSATAAGYDDADVHLTLHPGDGEPQPRTLTEVTGLPQAVEWEWDAGLVPHPLRLELALSPHAVALRGQVHESAAPFGPVDGATVALTTAPGAITTTDAGGRFAFATLPLVAAVTIDVTHPTHDPATLSVAVDYARPVNVCDVALQAH